MKSNFIQAVGIRCTALALTILPAVAAPYTDGQRVESSQTKNQFDDAVTLALLETRYLRVSHNLKTGKKAHAVLSPLGKVTVFMRSNGKVLSIAYCTPGAENTGDFLK